MSKILLAITAACAGGVEGTQPTVVRRVTEGCVNHSLPFSPRESFKSVAFGQPVATPLLLPDPSRDANGPRMRARRRRSRNCAEFRPETARPRA